MHSRTEIWLYACAEHYILTKTTQLEFATAVSLLLKNTTNHQASWKNKTKMVSIYKL